MAVKVKNPDHFISQLYREAPNIAIEEFATWSLDLLRQVIDFDGAVWATGHISTRRFHTQTTLDVSQDILQRLIDYTEINPIFEHLFKQQGQAVDMSDAIDDDAFYRSTVYRMCFEPFGIERILSSMHIDERSGLFTLLTLYRYDREHCFSEQEKLIQSRLLYHLISCASHRLSLELSVENNISAICDSKGMYHAVTAQFLDLIDGHIDTEQAGKFPIDFMLAADEFSHGELLFNKCQHGDLYKLSVRLQNSLDKLTEREKQVVQGICDGNTFKQIAKSLSLSPSTVSNHLYRIYLKLGVNTRSELVSLAQTVAVENH